MKNPIMLPANDWVALREAALVNYRGVFLSNNDDLTRYYSDKFRYYDRLLHSNKTED